MIPDLKVHKHGARGGWGMSLPWDCKDDGQRAKNQLHDQGRQEQPFGPSVVLEENLHC